MLPPKEKVHDSEDGYVEEGFSTYCRKILCLGVRETWISFIYLMCNCVQVTWKEAQRCYPEKAFICEVPGISL